MLSGVIFVSRVFNTGCKIKGRVVKMVLYKTFVDLIAFYLYVMVYERYKCISYDVGE